MAPALGGDLNAIDDNGETAMHGAAYKHTPSMVTLLAETGSDVDVWNEPNAQGWTPLDIATGVHRGMNVLTKQPADRRRPSHRAGGGRCAGSGRAVEVPGGLVAATSCGLRWLRSAPASGRVLGVLGCARRNRSGNQFGGEQ